MVGNNKKKAYALQNGTFDCSKTKQNKLKTTTKKAFTLLNKNIHHCRQGRAQKSSLASRELFVVVVVVIGCVFYHILFVSQIPYRLVSALEEL